MPELTKFKKWTEYFLNIKVAFFILIVSILAYMVTLDIEGAFTKTFLEFGPTQTTFMHMKVDSWDKVIIIYFMGFFSAVLLAYYTNVSDNFINKYLHNDDEKRTLNMSKNWVQMAYMGDQIIYKILTLISLFINITLQLQFILPGIIGKLAVDIPYGFYQIEKNNYTKKTTNIFSTK